MSTLEVSSFHVIALYNRYLFTYLLTRGQLDVGRCFFADTLASASTTRTSTTFAGPLDRFGCTMSAVSATKRHLSIVRTAAGAFTTARTPKTSSSPASYVSSITQSGS